MLGATNFLTVICTGTGRAARKPGPADNLLISNGPGRAGPNSLRAGPVNLGPYMARKQKMPRDMFTCAKAQLCIKSA